MTNLLFMLNLQPDLSGAHPEKLWESNGFRDSGNGGRK